MTGIAAASESAATPTAIPASLLMRFIGCDPPALP